MRSERWVKALGRRGRLSMQMRLNIQVMVKGQLLIRAPRADGWGLHIELFREGISGIWERGIASLIIIAGGWPFRQIRPCAGENIGYEVFIGYLCEPCVERSAAGRGYHIRFKRLITATTGD